MAAALCEDHEEAFFFRVVSSRQTKTLRNTKHEELLPQRRAANHTNRQTPGHNEIIPLERRQLGRSVLVGCLILQKKGGPI